ncbi:isoaspartyl peptidase/L-asparaginase family protein [Sphingomicrobium marinum]|uniref:isoaspartyl peptidase/L-asparaginase family protein n=1 Tax=Sphingomicrobium marinum TaxID=1227950 RepID=UPI00224064F1|nr:isoaspartyl peptidase/L-asparaginase [Sphingomicrobium marinum]
MPKAASTLAACIAMALATPAQAEDWSLVIHGGAGTIQRDAMTPEKDAEIRAALDAALEAGSAVLREGGSSLDAVTAAINILEDDPNFNAGRGAVFTWDETNSLDASIMRGDTLAAGAVAGASTTRHPIDLARKVMEESPHVLLSGEGADQFAREQGLEQVDPSFFFTQERYDALVRFKAHAMQEQQTSQIDVDYKFGTVGAVAMDQSGVITAGTSTGGMTGKRWGRIGDSPIIGAGTYANASCGVSATGTGEIFIRLAVAYRICAGSAWAETPEPVASVREEAIAALMGEVNNQTKTNADLAINAVGELGGSGGVIFLSSDGAPGWSFDTPGMYRGSATSDGEKVVAIYGDEE